MTDTYEVYAIKYAERVGLRGENFVYRDQHDQPMPMDYYVWAIVGKDRAFVLDLGFDPEEGKRRGRSHLRCPADALSLIGLDAAKVEQVIVSHMHYDHCGNLGRFPNARFWIQDREMAYATGRFMTHAALRIAFSVDYVCDLVEAAHDGRCKFVDGDREVAPGISVHHVGGHTDGLQVVRVWTRRGWMVLASDATHFYANMTAGNPFPIVFNVAHMMVAYDRLRELADGPDNIIPGHDPLVMARYPSPSPELKGIVARLDVPPTAPLT